MFASNEGYRYKDKDGNIHIGSDSSKLAKKDKKGATSIAVETVDSSINVETKVKRLLKPATLKIREVNGTPVTKAIFNDKVSRDILLDSGSELSFISTKLAKSLRLNYRSEPLFGFISNGKRFLAHKLVIDKLSLTPAIEIYNLEVAIIDHALKNEYSGVLGMNGLAKYKVSIDIANRLATFR